MSKNKKQGSGFIVYSTDPNYKPNDLGSLFGNLGGSSDSEDADSQNSLALHKQQVRIWLERHKGGKEATVIKGLDMSDDALSDMAKTLKNKCAAGGNAKDGDIIIQGNHRDKVLKLLVDLGYKNAKKAGG
jgi:translation initiation factor 1